MPVYKLTEAETFGVLPVDSIVQVEVMDVTERAVPGKDGKDGWMKLEFKFRITGVPSALEEEYGSLVDSFLWGSVSAKFTDHPDNKLRQWSECLLGVSVNQPGFELDTDILIGRKARAITAQYKRRDDTFAHQVATLLPLTTPSVTTTTVTPPAVQQTLTGASVGSGWAGSDDPPF